LVAQQPANATNSAAPAYKIPHPLNP